MTETITLSDIMRAARHAKKHILIGALLGAIAACIIIITAIPATRATMLLAPAENLNHTNKSAPDDKNMAILRLLASASGSSSSVYFEQFITTLTGPSTARIIMSDPKIIDGITKDLRFSFTPHVTSWTPEKISAYLKKQVKISAVGVTPIKKLEYWHPSPDFAVYLLARLHSATDQKIRAAKQISAQERKDHLKAQISTIQQTDHKRVMGDLLQEQERILMFSAINQPFSANIIEPASAHYKPQWPPRAILILICIAVGAMTGYGVHSLRRTS